MKSDKLSVSAFEDYKQGDKVEQVFSYPGARPDGSFVTDGETVTLLPDNYNAFVEAADEYLAGQGLLLIEERIPLLAYGANANPAKLRDKMSKYPVAEKLRDVLQVVPTIKAHVPDMVVVWHGKPAQSGGVFAELYQGEETQGERQPAHVAFVTNEQLAIIHVTEGVTYRFVELPVEMESGEVMLAAAYVADESVVLQRGGKPVKVAAMSTDPDALSAERAVDYMLENVKDGPMTAREQVIAWDGQSLAERKACQRKIQQRLGEAGASKTFRHPASRTGGLGRAQFSVVPGKAHDHTALQLLEESFEEGFRPTPEQVRKKARDLQEEHAGWPEDKVWRIAHLRTDPVHTVRQRAHDEIAARNRIDK